MVVEEYDFVNSETEAIKEALFSKGPLVTTFWVYEDFYYYTGGVYEYSWGDYEGGHCVAIVGWSNTNSCWICKNSWGADWGESGWFKIKWGHCGINSGVSWMTPNNFI